jgi:hypothetical protein
VSQKLTCGRCNTTDFPAFDGNCRFCAAPFSKKDGAVTNNENEIRECSNCSTEISEGEQFCTGCGEQIAEAAPAAPEPVQPHCSFCGLNVTESTEVCPRCDSTIALGEAEDDDKDDKDDDEDGEDGDGERKILKDKAGAAKEESAPEVVLSPTDEARLYVELASRLDKSQIDELAAHIVWSTQQESIETPRWLPTEYIGD